MIDGMPAEAAPAGSTLGDPLPTTGKVAPVVVVREGRATGPKKGCRGDSAASNSHGRGGAEELVWFPPALPASTPHRGNVGNRPPSQRGDTVTSEEKALALPSPPGKVRRRNMCAVAPPASLAR